MPALVGRTPLATLKAIAQAGTGYSDSMNFSRCTGDVAVFIKTVTGTCTISQQCSLDGDNWYDPVSAAAAALGVVCTAVAATTGTYIVYTPVLAPFIRFKIVETNVGALTVSLTLLFGED
jgi:hypothetical protein